MSESIIFKNIPRGGSTVTAFIQITNQLVRRCTWKLHAVTLTCFSSLFLCNPLSVTDDTCKLCSHTRLYGCWLGARTWMFHNFKAALRSDIPLYHFQSSKWPQFLKGLRFECTVHAYIHNNYDAYISLTHSHMHIYKCTYHANVAWHSL